MYTVVPKKPKYEADRDPYPFLDADQPWGLTDEEYKLRHAGGKYRRKREQIALLEEIIQELRGIDEMD